MKSVRDLTSLGKRGIRDTTVGERRARAWRKGSFAHGICRSIRRKRFWLLVILVTGIAGGIFMHHHGYYSPAETLEFLRHHSVIAPIIFIVLYVLLSIFLLPTLPLNLAAGVLWGWGLGTLLTLFGMVSGASIAFFIARYLGREFVTQNLRGKIWRMLWSAIETRGWKAVAFARINPVFPSAPLNYFFGLTGIAFWPYFFSTFLFIFPPSLLFAVLGDSIGGIVLSGSARDVVNKVLIASAAVTGLVFLKIFFKYIIEKNSST